jgi:hypothetical protein
MSLNQVVILDTFRAYHSDFKKKTYFQEQDWAWRLSYGWTFNKLNNIGNSDYLVKWFIDKLHENYFRNF